MTDQTTIEGFPSHGWALFGDGGSSSPYRYTLGRQLAAAGPRILFCMLNPSKATAEVMDPTVTRCFRYARAWGFGTMVVVNLFALRSTDPGALRRAADPVGPSNDWHIRDQANVADTIVAAWGAHPMASERARAVMPLLGRNVRCLKVTAQGHPHHPLYLRGNLSLIPYPEAR